MSFSGEFEIKVDDKGRMVLPAKVKANLPEVYTNELVLKRGFEPCLEVYPKLEWNKVFSKVSGLNQFNKEHRLFQRSFLNGVTDVDMDANGRILLPKTMLQFAGIEKELVVVGMGNRIEIWNPERYNQFLMSDDALSDMAAELLSNME